MADDDSRNEDAPKRPGKSSEPADDAGKPAERDKDTESTAKSGKKSDRKSSGDKKSDDRAVTTKDKGDKKSDDKRPSRGGPANFIREVVEQLRKVIYPTRKQLITYTVVVLVFVAIVIALVSGFDWVFSRGVQWLFGADTGE